MQKYRVYSKPPNISTTFFALFSNLLVKSLIYNYVIEHVFVVPAERERSSYTLFNIYMPKRVFPDGCIIMGRTQTTQKAQKRADSFETTDLHR